MDKKNKIKVLTPKNFMSNLKNCFVFIKLKWGMEYRGKLLSFDSFMNLRVERVEEWVNGKKIGFLGDVFIRCNNICFVSDFCPL